MNLKNLEVDPKYLKFGVTTFESDKQITIKQQDQQGNPVLVTVDIGSKNMQKKPIKAEMALSHPTRNILALRAKKQDNPNV
jgi:clathrin heavy chain